METIGRARASRFTRIGYLDIPGGGQVVVDGRWAYIGHMTPPYGTSIVDVADPRAPRLVSQVSIPDGIHSHKVRVLGDLMLVNHERYPAHGPGAGRSEQPPVGLVLYDIADRAKPRLIGRFPTAARGVHRFDLAGTRVFLSTEWEGFSTNILTIVDVARPERPEMVGQWWLPGQHVAAGEKPPAGRHYWVHLVLARGERAYAACGQAGAVILDIADPRTPRTIGSVAWNPPYTSPTHTVLPLPHTIRGRRFAVVTDEDVTDDLLEDPPAFMWVLDITNEARPVPVATYQADPDGLVVRGRRFGAHQPWEHVRPDSIVFLAWFSGGVRAVDVSDPYLPREVGHYVPPAPDGESAVQTNDIFVDTRGLVYAIDRGRGLSVLEYAPYAAR
ncbi:MAG TPA: hypothetical protein VJT33_18385 [bacterium]|nr:hypothetical protein [bacterium]